MAKCAPPDRHERADRSGVIEIDAAEQDLPGSWHAYYSEAVEIDNAVPGGKEAPLAGTSGSGDGSRRRRSRRCLVH